MATLRMQTWIHRRLWQGLRWFFALWLSHGLASETRIISLMFSITSSAIKKGRRSKNEVPYGTKHQVGYDALWTHLPWHPIPLALRGHSTLCSREYFASIKSQIHPQPELIGLTWWVVHVLPAEVWITHLGRLIPWQRNSSMPFLYRHQGNTLHETVLPNNLTFVKEKEPIRNQCTAHRNVCLHSSFTDLFGAWGINFQSLFFFIAYLSAVLLPANGVQ